MPRQLLASSSLNANGFPLSCYLGSLIPAVKGAFKVDPTGTTRANLCWQDDIASMIMAHLSSFLQIAMISVIGWETDQQ